MDLRQALTMQLVLAYGLWFGSVAVAGMAAYSTLARGVSAYLRQRSAEATAQLSEMFLNPPRQRVWLANAFSPVVAGVGAWLLTERAGMALAGAAVGFVLPRLVIRYLTRTRQKRFHGQLVDALLVMSSSLKAGLSMLQAFAVVGEEMSPPASQEFGLLLKQTRMGITLEEAMANLKRRMPSDDLNLFATAVLVSRETGGDITHLFGRLVETIRERKKLKERIKTLTFMARMQGILMGMLPIVFGVVVYRMNPGYFQWFLTDDVGRVMLAVVVTLQVIGAALFMRFARPPL